MNYTVILPATAEQQLAAIWNSASDRKAVTLAMDEIDRRLGGRDLTNGGSAVGFVFRFCVSGGGVW